MRKHLKLCILNALILKVTITSLFRLIHTFTVMFSSPSTRVLFSVIVIVFFEFCLFGHISLGHVFCITHKF